MVGAECHIVGRIPFETGLLPKMEALQSELLRSGETSMLIPVGGSDDVGLWGYIEAFEELHAQLEASSVKVDDIFIGCGSGDIAAMCIG